DVLKSSYFGNAEKEFSSRLIEKVEFQLTGLQSDKSYNVVFFSSRSGGTVDNKETKLIASGSNVVKDSIDATNNSTHLGYLNEVKPNNNGTIKFILTAGKNNNNENGFYYLNLLRVT